MGNTYAPTAVPGYSETGAWSNSASSAVTTVTGATFAFPFAGAALSVQFNPGSNHSNVQIAVDGTVVVAGQSTVPAYTFVASGLSSGSHTCVLTNLGTNPGPYLDIASVTFGPPAPSIGTVTTNLAAPVAVPDGSFEAPIAGGAAYGPPASSPWALTGGASFHTASSPYGPPPAVAGAQCLGIQNGGSATQVFPCPPGQYALSFSMAARVANDGAARNPIDVHVNGVVVATVTANGAAYQQFQIPIAIATSTLRLAFVGTNTGPDATMFIDAVGVAGTVSQFGVLELTLPVTTSTLAPTRTLGPLPSSVTARIPVTEDPRNGVLVGATFTPPTVPLPTAVPGGPVPTAGNWTTGPNTSYNAGGYQGGTISSNNGAGSFSTSLAGLSPGLTYRVDLTVASFYASKVLHVTLDGTQQDTPVLAGGNQPPSTFSLTFVAGSGPGHSLAIASDAGNGDIHITGVAVTQVPAAVYQPGYYTGRPGQFKVRFAPFAPGAWTCQPQFQDAGGPIQAPLFTFYCSPGASKGYVVAAASKRVRPTDNGARDGKWFTYSNSDEVFLPAGCGTYNGGLEAETFDLACAAGGFYGLQRVWLADGGMNMLDPCGDASDANQVSVGVVNCTVVSDIEIMAHSGRNCARVPPTPSGLGGARLQPQYLGAPTNTPLIVTGWVYLDGCTLSGPPVVSLFNLGGQSGGVVDSGSGWRHFSLNVPPLGTLFDLSISVTQVTSGNYYFDDVVFTDATGYDYLGGGGSFDYQVTPNYRFADRFDTLIQRYQANGLYVFLNLLEKGNGDRGNINPDGSSLRAIKQHDDSTNGANAGGADPNGHTYSLMLDTIRYVVARYGAFTAFAMAEGCNEANDGNGNHFRMGQVVQQVLRALAPNYGGAIRPVSQSTGQGGVLVPLMYDSEPTGSQFPTSDFAQIHLNLALDTSSDPNIYNGLPFTSFYNEAHGGRPAVEVGARFTVGAGGPHGLGKITIIPPDGPLLFTFPKPVVSAVPGLAAPGTYTVVAYVKAEAGFTASGPIGVNMSYQVDGFASGFQGHMAGGAGVINLADITPLWKQVTLCTFTVTGPCPYPLLRINNSVTLTGGAFSLSELRVIGPDGSDWWRIDGDDATRGDTDGLTYSIAYNATAAPRGGAACLNKPIVIGEQNFPEDLNKASLNIRALVREQLWGQISPMAVYSLWWGESAGPIAAVGGFAPARAVQAFVRGVDLTSGYWREMPVRFPAVGATGVRQVRGFGQSDMNYGNPNGSHAIVVVLPKSGFAVQAGYAEFTLPAGAHSYQHWDIGLGAPVATGTLHSDGVTPTQYRHAASTAGFALKIGY